MQTRALQFCLVFALVALVQDRAQAYSVNATDDGVPIRWGVDHVALRLDPALERWLAPGEAFSALAMAFDAWRGLPRVPDLVVRQGGAGKPGYHEHGSVNGVYLVQRWEHAPEKLAVTVVTFELETGRLLDADVLVNPNVQFRLLSEDGNVGTCGQYDLAAVLTHEAGHVLGLGESDEHPDATMWPYASPGDVHQRTLSDDDEQGAIDAYAGPPPEPAAGCGAMRVSHGARHASLGAAWLFALVLVGLWLRRRSLVMPGLCMGLTGLLLMPAPQAPSTGDERAVASGAYGASVEIESRAARELQSLRKLRGDAARIDLGRLELRETRFDDGLLRTSYSLRAEDGSVRELSVLGGEHEGIGQRVVGAPVPPRDGDSVGVAVQPDGSVRWAHWGDGRLRGGDLGAHGDVALVPLD